MLRLSDGQHLVVCSHFSVINIIGNLAESNLDLETYGYGRFDIQEGGLLTLRVDVDRLKEVLKDYGS
jgi:hypothetical protein